GILPALEQGLRDARSGTKSPFAELLTRGLYARQLTPYLQHFPAEQALVGAYDDVVADAAATIAEIYRFLEVDSTFIPPSLSTRPKANAFSDVLISLERLAPRSRIVAHTSGFLNNAMRRLRVGGTHPQIPARLNTELRAFFRDDLRQLDRLLSGTHVLSRQTRQTVRGWDD
ncbi:MAG: sulfotransferase domain-containing protein, partial [Gemmatimonadaceae bacterium]